MKYKLLLLFTITTLSACSKSNELSPCNENTVVPCVEDANQEYIPN